MRPWHFYAAKLSEPEKFRIEYKVCNTGDAPLLKIFSITKGTWRLTFWKFTRRKVV